MSFQQGLSGLNSSSQQLNTIGNNVANASTVGFKQSQAQFADMFAASLSGGGAVQIGTGTKVAAVAQQFTQGNITNTNNSLDIAISGNGFFRMQDQNLAIKYSRNGQFQVDKSGFVVNNQGHNVMGYMPLANGVMDTTTPVALQISAADLLPKQTANIAAGGTPVAVGLNLDSRATFPLSIIQASVSGSGAAGLTVTAANNTLSGTVDGVTFAATIPIATYADAASLATAVQVAVNANAALIAAGKTVTVTADATGVLTMKSNAAGPMSGVTVTGTALTVGGPINGLFGPTGGTPVSVLGAGAFNPADPTTYNNSTSLTIYDSQGASHIASLYFQKTSPNSWDTYLTIDGAKLPAASPTKATAVGTTADVTVASIAGLAIGDTISIGAAGVGGAAHTAKITAIDPATKKLTFSPVATSAPALGVAVVPKFAALEFSTTGTLTKPAAAMPLGLGQVVSGSFYPNGANPQTLTFDFAQSSQYGGAFGVNTLTQDGYASGRLNGFSTGTDGTILARYSNGQSKALGQMMLVNFSNPQGLQPVGNNEWVNTSASGLEVPGTPGSASLGLLQSSAVEDSNVDLTAELVNMITAQRVYQANAQTIKTQDQVLQTLVNLR